MTTPSLHLRPARPLDAGKLAAILDTHLAGQPWLPRVRSRAEDIALIGRMIDAGWVTVAERGGRIAGFLARDGAQVHALYVHPDEQRSGIGSALLDRARRERPDLRLQVHERNVAALRFYRARGFVPAPACGPLNDEGLAEVSLTLPAKESVP